MDAGMVDLRPSVAAHPQGPGNVGSTARRGLRRGSTVIAFAGSAMKIVQDQRDVGVGHREFQLASRCLADNNGEARELQRNPGYIPVAPEALRPLLGQFPGLPGSISGAYPGFSR